MLAVAKVGALNIPCSHILTAVPQRLKMPLKVFAAAPELLNASDDFVVLALLNHPAESLEAEAVL